MNNLRDRWKNLMDLADQVSNSPSVTSYIYVTEINPGVFRNKNIYLFKYFKKPKEHLGDVTKALIFFLGGGMFLSYIHDKLPEEFLLKVYVDLCSSLASENAQLQFHKQQLNFIEKL